MKKRIEEKTKKKMSGYTNNINNTNHIIRRIKKDQCLFLLNTVAILAITSLAIVTIFDGILSSALGQETTNDRSKSFLLMNSSSPVPSTWDRILTDEINALKADINTIKNASTMGDFEVVYNKTLEVVTGPNWGNISADLLFRKDLIPLNNFVMTLESLNTLTTNTTEHTKAVNDTIIEKSNTLVTNYGKVLDALAVPIFDILKIITNLVIPGIIVVIIILAIPTIRRRYKIRY